MSSVEQVGPRVFNKHHRNAPPGAVYIGRGSPYGNPFVIGRDGDRAAVIAAYEAHLLSDVALLERVRTELRGRDVVCFCAPAPCHGDVLVRIANEQDTDFDDSGSPQDGGF